MALTGVDLLAKVKELEDAIKSDLVRAAGSVSSKKDGNERLNVTAFYEALLAGKAYTVLFDLKLRQAFTSVTGGV